MIDVIIPVYRGLAQTRRCLDSVLASRVSAPHEVVVIDDASPEPALREWLREVAASGRITLIAHAENRGFVATANEGMRLHADRDLVLLNSDTEVAEGWLDRLAACATREPGIGTVTPFSNNATICSYPDMSPPHGLPEGMDTASMDSLFRAENAGRCVDIPTGVGFCLYIRRACLDAVGAFDEAAFGAGYGEEVDFCLRAARAGWRSVLAADVFVFHEGEVSFGGDGAARRAAAQRVVDERFPGFPATVRDFVLRDPAAPARERVAARLASIAQARGLSPALPADVLAPILVVVIGSDDEEALAQACLREAARQSLLPGGSGHLLRAQTLPAHLAQLLRNAPGRDVVLAVPQVTLPMGWDARLAKALHAQPAIAAASPLVVGDPFLSPLPPDIPAPAEGERLDAAAFNAGDRRYYESPALASACVAVKRATLTAALEAKVAGDSLPAFVAALAAHFRRGGQSGVVLDHLCVSGRGLPPSSVSDPIEASAFLRHCPLGPLRRTLAEAVSLGLPRAVRPGLEARPVRLHVMHYWGGGVERWVHDFARADAGAIHLTFASYRIGDDGGQRFELRTFPTDKVPARTWDLAQPFRATSIGSIEYRRLLQEVMTDFCVDGVVVSSLIGHSLDVLETGKPTLVVMHDLYPVCQAINPTFNGRVCERCEAPDLDACRATNPLNIVFRKTATADWMALRSAFTDRLVQTRPQVVVPSHWVRDSLLHLEPRLARASISVVGHGIDERPERLRYPSRSAGERLRLAVVGRLSEVKGSKLLESAANGLSSHADVWIVGEGKAGKRLAEAHGWQHVGGYTPETLRSVLAEIAPHAAILPTVVPETFSFTLSELLNLGVVPLVTARGSFAERVRHGDNGFLFEPDPHHLVALVRVLQAEPQRLADVAARLAAGAPEPTTGAMVAAYRPMLPPIPQPAARYPIGVGAQTGLSEPYRHLTRAYAEMQAAYQSLHASYEQTRGALDLATATMDARQRELALQVATAAMDARQREQENDRRREAAERKLDGIRLEWNRWISEFEAIDLPRRPWRIRQALAKWKAGRARLGHRINDVREDES